MTHSERLQVVAFTATQIPGIDDKKYPPELAGPLYPQGIQIYPEEELEQLLKKFNVNKWGSHRSCICILPCHLFTLPAHVHA